jgi:intracellular septation protein
MWIVFFTAVGILNLIIAEHVSFDTWTDFKLWGVLGLTILFVVMQSFYLARHVKEPVTTQNEEV